MTPVETLLSLIETVYPSDFSKIEEINARTWCYMANYTFLGKKNEWHFELNNGKVETFFEWSDTPKYANNRLLLKMNRPKGWYITHQGSPMHKPQISSCTMVKTDGDDRHFILSPFFPTEELAELWCIISAIAYERSKS